MRRALVHWFLVGTLTLSVGFHWPVLQGAAWTGMFLSRVRTQSVAAALQSTFNGHNPCRVCRLVASSHSKEKPADGATIDLRQIEARSWAGGEIRVEGPRLAALPRQSFPAPSSRSLAPPVPPPRTSVA